jgi:chromosome segregation ATPase
MESTVTLVKVTRAIEHLQQRGERVSRRNVQAITGGGMSTVHKLMSQVEDNNALLVTIPAPGISKALQTAIRTEIATEIQNATEVLNAQIHQLQGREVEAIEALAEAEGKAERLSAELKTLRNQTDLVRQDAEKNQAVSAETIGRLEGIIREFDNERRDLNASLESARIEITKAELKLDLANQITEKAEAVAEQQRAEVIKVRKFLVESEKKAAVAWQKVKDLREALTKAEGRIRRLTG